MIAPWAFKPFAYTAATTTMGSFPIFAAVAHEIDVNSEGEWRPSETEPPLAHAANAMLMQHSIPLAAQGSLPWRTSPIRPFKSDPAGGIYTTLSLQ